MFNITVNIKASQSNIFQYFNCNRSCYNAFAFMSFAFGPQMSMYLNTFPGADSGLYQSLQIPHNNVHVFGRDYAYFNNIDRRTKH